MTARPTSLYPRESLNKEDHAIVKAEGNQYSPLQPLECHKATVPHATCADPASLPTDDRSEIVGEEELLSVTNIKGGKEDEDMVDSGASPKVLQELQDVGDASVDEATYRLRMLSSPRSFMDNSAEAGRFLVSDIEEKTKTRKGTLYESLIGSSSKDSVATDVRFLVSDIEEEAEMCKGTAYESLLGSSREDSVATNGEMQYDASASASDSSSSEILFNMELDNSTLLPEKAKCEKEFSSHGVDDVVLKTDGGISSGKKLKPLCIFWETPTRQMCQEGSRREVCQNSTLCDTTNACAQSGLSCEKAKLKPLCTSGFLVKRPRNKRPRDKCAKQEVRGEVCQNSTLCDPTNACTQSGLSCEKPKLKPLFTPGFLGNRPRDKCAKQEVRGQVSHNSTLCDPTTACTQSGLSSEKPKLKPLFTPGFLGRRPHEKCAKQEVKRGSFSE